MAPKGPGPMEAARKKLESMLLGRPGVNGIGIGRAGDGRACVTVLLETDRPETRSAIPSDVDGVPVDVKVLGKFRAH